MGESHNLTKWRQCHYLHGIYVIMSKDDIGMVHNKLNVFPNFLKDEKIWCTNVKQTYVGYFGSILSKHKEKCCKKYVFLNSKA